MQLDELTIVNKIQRALKDKYHNIGESMMSGTVDNMEKYKYMLGQAHAYQIVIQEISNLLKNDKEQDEQGNVIDIKGGSTKN